MNEIIIPINKRENAVREWEPPEEKAREPEISLSEKIWTTEPTRVATKWQKAGVALFHILIAVLPFTFLPFTIFPGEAGKQTIAAALALLALAAYFLDTLTVGRVRCPVSRIALAVGGVIVAFAASAIFSSGRIHSVFGGALEPDTLFAVLLYGIVFFLAAVWMRDEKGESRARSFSLAFIIGFAVSLATGFLYLFGKMPVNLFGTSFPWAIFLAFGFVMFIAAWDTSRLPLSGRVTLGLLALGAGAALVLLNYQLVWAVVVGAMILIASGGILRSRGKGHLARRFSLSTSVMGIAFLLFLSGGIIPIIARPAEVDIRPSISATFQVIKGVFHGSRILWGSGPATFGYSYDLFKPTAFSQTEFWQARFSQGVSFIATLPATTGLLGFIAVIILIALVAVQFFKMRERDDHAMLPITIGAFFVAGMWFLYPAVFALNLFFFFSIGAIVGLSDKVKTFSFETARRPIGIGTAVAANILLTVVVGLIYLNGQRYTAAVFYKRGIDAIGGGDKEKSAKFLERARRFDPYSDRYLRDASQALVTKASDLQAKLNAEKSAQAQAPIVSEIQNAVARAITLAQEATLRFPADSLNWTNLGMAYERLIPIVGGASKFLEGNYKRAAELNPSDPAAQVNFARGIILQSGAVEKKSELEKILTKAIQLRPGYAPAYYHLGLLYYQSDSAKTRSALETALDLDPTNSSASLLLGFTYRSQGLRDKAIAAFERTLKIDAGNAEAKEALAELRSSASSPAENIAPTATSTTGRQRE